MIDGAQAHKEIELKFVLDEPAMRKVLRQPLLADIDCQHRSQRSVYFDTAKSSLKKRGYTLRVREAGNVFTQTLKTRVSHAGLFDRREWEIAVSGSEPDLALLARAPIRNLQDFDGELVPVVRSDVERTIWLVAEWRDRKMVWWCSFGSEAEALEAARLRE